MKRKASGRGSRKLFRVVLVSFCLLWVAVSPLAAWPQLFGGRDKSVEIPAESPAPEVEETVTVVATPQPQPQPSTSYSENSGTVSTTPSTSSEVSLISSDTAAYNELSAEIKAEFAALTRKIEEAKGTEKIEDSLAEDVGNELDSVGAKLDNALQANADQADKLAVQSAEIDTLKASLKKEQSMKTFAELNFLLGFEDLKPEYGVGAAMGLRFGKGLMLKLGANYMVGSFTKVPTFSLDDLQITAGIGWEW